MVKKMKKYLFPGNCDGMISSNNNRHQTGMPIFIIG